MELRVFLKVCEGCGCLWYRTQAEIRVYCSSCLDRFKEFPIPESKRPVGRPKKLTLPTVFAVQAHAHSELDFPFNQSRSFPGAPASQAAFSGTAVTGGAQ